MDPAGGESELGVAHGSFDDLLLHLIHLLLVVPPPLDTSFGTPVIIVLVPPVLSANIHNVL